MHRPLQQPIPAHAHRLVRWQRLVLYAAGTLLLLTGGAWLAVHYSIGAGAGELPHPFEAWSMRVHGLGAFAGTFALGALAAAHIPQGLRLSHRRRWAGQRRSGLSLCVLGGLLVGSGYALYYFAPEAIRPTLGLTHAVIGIVTGVSIGIHRRGIRGINL